MTGMKPKDMIRLEDVLLVNPENYLLEEMLPEDGLYHYLLQPDEEHKDRCKKAVDRIWSEKSYGLRKVASSPSNCVMYCLSDGTAFVKEELMLIPEDTELPPNYIQKW